MNWKKSKNELPPKNMEVLIIYSESYWLAEITADGKWKDTQVGFEFDLDEVEYWMPLPQLPQQLESDKED